MTDLPSQRPTGEDYRRAGALVVHHLDGNGSGGLAVLQEVVAADRSVALVRALVVLAATPTPADADAEWWRGVTLAFAAQADTTHEEDPDD